MKSSWQIKRLITFYKENGFVNLLHRIRIIFWRNIFQNKTILYHLDLMDFHDNGIKLPEQMKIQRKKIEGELSDQDYKTLIAQRGKYRGAEKIKSQFKERFQKNAQFWLIKQDKNFAGFLWSIRNGYVVPFYIPLTKNDVVIFDIETFPEFRGKGINPLLMNYAIHELKKEGVTRIFVTVKIWNVSSMRAMAKTQFKKIGIARKMYFRGRDITIWYDM